MNKSTRVTAAALMLLFIAESGYGQQLPPAQLNPGDLRNSVQQSPANPAQLTTVTQRRAVALARQQYAGNILRISLVGEGANQRYQIRMENEGKVFTVFVHATTGQVSSGG
ncbi:MAG: PepSY domain-containing protein [Gammaproteobacteria bacterium]|nr:PepSY domain-containing protein [Gammaproteobacteria bacterium]MBT3858945.1 PepSY domain-containing protein [Gammaproteobacteria bacterium]MBT3988273.1 PepSY domain-containing protein [Gammaproteobacteria bacterium]MBT4257278.1 PepSY domain-containing protein [Gammaproteobacteria bacterium]MBT4582543.1 PepSY domain-containing protein [Gammaproteobacteria bacterium]